MKWSKFALLGALCTGAAFASANDGQFAAHQAGYQSSVGTYGNIQQVSHTGCATCGEPVCGCEAVCDMPSCEDGGCDTFGCSDGCDGGCDGGGCGGGMGLGLGDCGGDPFALFGSLPGNITAGGWVQMGYHSRRSPLRFNNHDGNLHLQQGWLFAEKALDTSDGFDFGGRIDYVYGVDAQDTQAFGIPNNHWDNGWDNGIYGHALPQVYGEAGYGDLSVKVGHFYTTIGWEVVTAPDNFFYSHAYTMFNSEPFTHTGALFNYAVNDDTNIFGGYVMGWDSGFEDNGDAFLGGFGSNITDDIAFTYSSVAGRFGNASGERGYMQSIVFDVAVTEKLQYIFQSDLLSSENAAGVSFRETIGINQYFIYSINDCIAAGARFEWWNIGGSNFHNNPLENSDVYDLTLGLNVKPHANVLIRPEVRWDWQKGLNGATVNELGTSSQTTFGIDTIFLF